MLNRSRTSVSKNSNRNELSKVFFTVFGISCIAVLLCIIFAGYHFEQNVLRCGTNRFMDFFDSCRDASVPTVYTERGVIYPPLAVLFYRFINLFIRDSYLAATRADMLTAYTDNTAMIAFMIYLIATTVLLAIVLYQNKRGSIPEKLLFTFFMMLSYPFIYGFERGNIIVLAVSLTAFFAFCHNSSKKAVKELALISLAIATAFKIYPIIAVLLLLQEKKVKEAFRTIVYSIVLFFGPFVFFGGLSGFQSFLKNTIKFAAHRAGTPIVGDPSLQVLVSGLFSAPGLLWLSGAVTMIVFILGAFSILVTKTQWKRWGLVFALLCNFPGANSPYIWMFAVIPVMLMLDQKTCRRGDLIYLLLFSSFLIYYPVFINLISPVNGYIVCAVTGIIFMMLVSEAIYQYAHEPG